MTKLIVGNWKMNLGLAESKTLAQGYAKEFQESQNEIVACPAFFALPAVSEILAGTPVAWGAQDVFWVDKGAYTGEVSPTNLKELGCKYVILGHSERRQYLGESCKLINMKVKACLAIGLTPIICVGENWEKRAAGGSATFVAGQLKRALADIVLSSGQELVIAYEPVWAIGSGQVIQVSEAKIMHAMIKKTVAKLIGVSDKARVIYGGSVDELNAAALLSLPEIDGFLVGGASLYFTKFYKIANIK